LQHATATAEQQQQWHINHYVAASSRNNCEQILHESAEKPEWGWDGDGVGRMGYRWTGSD